MRNNDERGFSMVEMMVSLIVLSFAMAGLFGLLVHNSKVNKSEQMKAEVQANARSTMAVVVQQLRSAGWDPLSANTFAGVTVDSDFTDSVSEITVRSDFDSALTPGEPDGLITETGEEVLFRHTGTELLWRRSALGAFEILSVNISNDSDGDGTPENMFVPDDIANPTRITVQLTAQSPVVDPVTRDFLRYTMVTDVVLRKEL